MIAPAPYLPPLWDANRILAATVLALLPALIMAIAERGVGIMGPLVMAIGLAALWSLVFARMRHRPMGWDGVVTALVFVLLLPGPVPLWQQAMALSFGHVMGDLIFGGRGRGFLNPVVVGLAFLLFSFPGAAALSPGSSVALAAAAGGALLLALGLVSWRIVAGFAIGAAALMALAAGPDEWRALPSASLVIGLVFLIGDPVAAACTNPGRWVYGGLAGGLAGLLGLAGDGIGSLAAVVFAALLASIFAPLIDQIVIAANVRRQGRRQRNG